MTKFQLEAILNDADGNPLNAKPVVFYQSDDGYAFNCVGASETDVDGKATFELETDVNPVWFKARFEGDGEYGKAEEIVGVNYADGRICPDRFGKILIRFGAQATVKRRITVTVDDYGNPVENWLNIGSENVIVKAVRADEKIKLPGAFQDAELKFFLKPVSPVRQGDRLIIDDSEVYQVLIILPQRLGKCIHHLLAMVKRVVEED